MCVVTFFVTPLATLRHRAGGGQIEYEISLSPLFPNQTKSKIKITTVLGDTYSDGTTEP